MREATARPSVQPGMMRYAAVLACALVVACTGRPPPPQPVSHVAAAPSARKTEPDTRGPSSEHPEAIAHLLESPWSTRIDRRHTVALPLPDGASWTHVKYWGVTTLAGYRYGDEHHVALAVFSFVAPPSGATVEGCAAKFHAWGAARAKQFDVEVGEPRVEDFVWPVASKTKARVFVLDARRRSLLGTKRYAAAYAVYPAWSDACLVVGFGVPERDAPDLARALRDRLVSDALPALVVKPGAGAIALEAKSDVD